MQLRLHVKQTVPRLFLCLLATILAPSCDRTLKRADIVLINGGEPDTIDPAKIRGQPEGRIAFSLYVNNLAVAKGDPAIVAGQALGEIASLAWEHLR